jgi:hypothetical protein
MSSTSQRDLTATPIDAKLLTAAKDREIRAVVRAGSFKTSQAVKTKTKDMKGHKNVGLF